MGKIHKNWALSRRARKMLLSLLATSLVALVIAWLLSPPRGQESKLVTVARGQSVTQVAYMLADQGLIRSPRALIIAAYLSGKWRRIQAGRHELAPTMTALDILDALCRGRRRAWRWLTIPEGYTLRQVAKVVEQKKLGISSDFLQEAQNPFPFEVEFPIPTSGLEGYLFPDTYRVEVVEKTSSIIEQMLRRFDQVVWQGMFKKKASYRGRQLNDIIILASLVEAEAKRAQERPVIAGVLMNRLKLGRKLECDATIQYILGDGRKERLTQQDLMIESDYNTYRHVGLPPGPICNPGEASIAAAMDPAEVPYLYYVARPDGSHVFSTSFEDHRAVIATIRRGR